MLVDQKSLHLILGSNNQNTYGDQLFSAEQTPTSRILTENLRFDFKRRMTCGALGFDAFALPVQMKVELLL